MPYTPIQLTPSSSPVIGNNTMPRKKITDELQPVETKVEVATEESAAKQEFRAFIEKVKEQHPNKYPQLKAELEKQLNQL